MNELRALLALLTKAPLVAIRSGESTLGFIILMIIESPVLILIISSFIGRPRRAKVTGLFIGWLILMFGVFVGGIYVLSMIFSLFY